MEETICAISTSLGVGAISIIRVCGKDAIKIVDSIFSGDLIHANSHTIKYGFIMDDKEKVDEVLVMLMKSPKTYTMQDTVEINCHGGYITTNKVLEILLDRGCRLAEPGEFTKRAFLNGRINLLQSEAVNELISAKTESKRKLALNQMGDKLTNQIKEIRDELLSLMANIEVNIDYPEYTDNLVVTNNLLNTILRKNLAKLEKLLEGAKYGRLITNGINVAIVGKPNVGKSSILNHLLDEQKAIVTDIAGTTRDIVEGFISLKGIEVKLVDTAGIHETSDVVEKIGVEKSNQAINNADVILLTIDGSNALDDDDKRLLESCDKAKTIVFINKSDMGCKVHIEDFDYVVSGNTKDITGLDALKDALIKLFNINEINKDLTYLSSARQIDLVKKALAALKKALESLGKDLPIDMIEIDLQSAYDYLGQIIGDTYEDALIDRLFENFCVGK